MARYMHCNLELEKAGDAAHQAAASVSQLTEKALEGVKATAQSTTPNANA